jgi:hypothetical protein
MVEKKAGYEYAEGTIAEHCRALEFAVRLGDGRDVVAAIPKSRLKKPGCLLGSLVGWRVTVVFRWPPKMPTILEIRHSDNQHEHVR